MIDKMVDEYDIGNIVRVSTMRYYSKISYQEYVDENHTRES